MHTVATYINFGLCIFLIFNCLMTYSKLNKFDRRNCRDGKLFIVSLVFTNAVLLITYTVLQLFVQTGHSLESFRSASFIIMILILNAFLVLLRRI